MCSFSEVAGFKITIISRCHIRDKPLYLTLPHSYKTTTQPGLVKFQIMIIPVSTALQENVNHPQRVHHLLSSPLRPLCVSELFSDNEFHDSEESNIRNNHRKYSCDVVSLCQGFMFLLTSPICCCLFLSEKLLVHWNSSVP